MSFEVILPRHKKSVRNHGRCGPCSEERLDGKPCNTKTCLCACHRMSARDMSLRKDLRAIRSFRGMEDWTVPMSFEEEVAAGKFGEMKPQLVKQ